MMVETSSTIVQLKINIMKNRYFNPLALLMATVMLTASLIGCTSTTMIHTLPEGARVYMNDEFRGVTPYRHTDSAISGTVTAMTFRKEGFQDFHTTLHKNENVHVGAVIGGILFFFPFIWTMGYNPAHNYELNPVHP